MQDKLKIGLYSTDTAFSKGFVKYYENDKYQIQLFRKVEMLMECNSDLLFIDAECAVNWWSLEVVKRGIPIVVLSSIFQRYYKVLFVSKAQLSQNLNDDIAKYLKDANDDLAIFERHTTKIEFEILECLSEGLTTKEIATLCKVSVATINAHRLSLIKKYHVNNTAHLVYTYLKKLTEVS
jgi:DNA-binding CsgD family transcriptional regulator